MRSPHNRLALRLVLMVWLASLSIFLPVAFANHSTDYSIVLDSFSYDSGSNLSTYTWKLTTSGDTDSVSHVVIDTCLGNTAQSTGGSPDGSAEYKNPDPSTGSSGYKWESNLPVGSTFILKFTGNKGQSGTATWTIKKGPDGHEKDGTAAGPSCAKSDLDPFETESSEQGTIQPGTSVTDTATASGTAGDPSGTVSFYLCGPGGVPTGCLLTSNKIGADKTLSGGTSSSSSATSDAAAPTDPGRYCWRAEYSGDSNYNSATHTNNDTECFEVAQAPQKTDPTITTKSKPNGKIDPGDSVTDTVDVDGQPGQKPTGSVTFYLCGPDAVATPCVLGTQVGGSKTLSNSGHAESDAANPTALGHYCWRVVYEGDSNYNSGSHTNSDTECFEVEDSNQGGGGGSVDPDISTSSSEQGTIQPGTSVTDHVVVDGAHGRAKGDVTFYLCGPGATNGCTSTSNKIGADKTLDKDGEATSDSVAPTDPGRYCWRVRFESSQSKYNDKSHTNTSTECFEVAGSSSGTAAPTTVLGAQITAGGGADAAPAAAELPKTGSPIPILPALILAINLMAAGGMIRKLAILEELEKAGR